MTIADVAEFYVRRDAVQATGDEEPCTGCDAKLAADDWFSHYDLGDVMRTPRAFPATIVLCQGCTYMVIGFGPVIKPE